MKLPKICHSQPSALVQWIWLTEAGPSEEEELERRKKRGREKWNESGTRREKREKWLSRFKGRGGKGGKEGRHRVWNPLSRLGVRNENLCRYQGGCFLCWCFYSNSYYVLIFTNLQSYYYATSEKRNTNARNDMIISNQAETDVIV